MLRLEHVTKHFGETTAVDDVTLSIDRGEIIGLVGENGAGKTTLMRIVAGELAPDSGGQPPRLTVGMVHQHFALVPQFTVAENLALVLERGIRLVDLDRKAEEIIREGGIALQGVDRLAEDLAVGEKAKLELVKAVAARPQLLILDEPTSVLTQMEAEELFRRIREMAAGGTSIVFISHKVPEVLSIAKRIVVMRRGRIVADRSAKGLTAENIAEAMVGMQGERRTAKGERENGATSTLRLRAEALSGDILSDVSFEVNSGETIAVVGVAGNGQTELAMMLRGLRTPRAGRLSIETDRVGFIPEDRTRDALVAEMSIAENLALGGDSWNPAEATERAERLIALYDIRARGPRQRAGELSGGNQQKVVLARELDRKPELIIAAEPTRGLDIEATRFVHEQLMHAVETGAGLLVITSDLDEAFALAQGIHVIYRGRLSARLTPAEAAQRVGQLMAGVA